MKGLVYSSVNFYKFIMWLLYKGKTKERDEIISSQIGSLGVLDLCCGYGNLTKYVDKYKGIDFNKTFVKYARKKGLDVSFGDIREDFPEEECIVIQASLYHFIPEHRKLIERILQKAKVKVIISESYKNLTHSKSKFLSWISKVLTKTEKVHKRFTKQELIDLFKEYNANKIILTDRDLIGVFEKEKGS